MPSQFEFFTVDHVSERLGINPATLYRMMKRGIAPPWYKIGGRRLWREDDLEEWIEAQRVDGGKRAVRAGV